MQLTSGEMCVLSEARMLSMGGPSAMISQEPPTAASGSTSASDEPRVSSTTRVRAPNVA